MNDEPAPNPSAATEPQLPASGNVVQSSQTSSPTSSPPASLAPAPPPSGPITPKHSSRFKQWLMLVMLIVVVVAVGGVVASRLLKTTSTKAPVVTKKDIPLLTYGDTSGGEVPQYPVSYLYNNIDIEIALQMFEGLVGYQDQTKIVPLLATSWSNPNDTTWVFNLRHNVKFNTGRTMTAADVKFSLDYAVAHQNDDNGNSTFFFEASTIKNVDATGTYQVTVTTNGPDPVLLNRLSFLGIVDSKATLGDYSAGTGPYHVKVGTTPTASSIDLAASNSYWGGHVYTREVKISLPSDTTSLAADAAAGKYNLSGYYGSSQASTIKNTQSINLSEQGLEYLGLNTERSGSPLQSLSAREAVAYALNVPAILKSDGSAGEQASQIVPTQLPGHNPAISNTPSNLAKAKQLLASAPNASAPLTFAYTSATSTQVDEIISELKAAGFNVQPVVVSDFSTLINDTLAGQYDMFKAGDSSGTVDGLDLLKDLLVNNGYYDNSQIDSLITQAGTTLNTATRINEMQQIASIVSSQKPIIPLYTQTQVYALSKQYVAKPDLPGTAASIYFWKVYQN